MTTTFEKIRAIIVRDFELPPERLQRDTLLAEIELDSLSITELVFSIEDEFQITAENTIPAFKTLGDIADYVARLVAERDTKPRVAAKAVEAASIPTKTAAPPTTPKRRRSAAKTATSSANGAPKPRSAANGTSSEPTKRSGRNANGKALKRANGKSAANGANAGDAKRTKVARAAKRSAQGETSRDAPPRKPKRSGGGRVGARAR